MADSLINNPDQPRGHCGHYIRVLERGNHLIRGYCEACGKTQTLHLESEMGDSSDNTKLE